MRGAVHEQGSAPIASDRAAYRGWALRACYIVDSTGKRYIDASGGAAVSCLGHAHPDVLAAMHAQIDKLAYAHTSFFTTEVAEALADHLIKHAPQGLSHVYFVSGGSEAIEAALKLARQYFVEIGQPERTVFVARRQSYHGNTLGALAVGGNEWRRRQFAPLLMAVGRVAPCYEYRDRRTDESRDAYTKRLLGELEAEFQRLGPQRVIAFVAEPVGGATSGAVPPTPGYFAGVRALCDRHGILFIADEVMCGMGRTGTLHAIEQEDVVPDLLAIAKGLGGGYQPVGALLRRRAGSSPPCARAAACSSMATPTSAIRRPPRRPWQYNRSSSATGCCRPCASAAATCAGA